MLRDGFFKRKVPRAYRSVFPVYAGILSLAGCAVYLFLPGGKFLSLMLALFGAAMLLLAWLGRLCASPRRGAAAFLLRRLLQLAVLGFLALFIAVEGVIICNEKPAADRSAPCAILFGAGLNGEAPSAALLSRLHAAEEWLSENPRAVVAVSGGQGAGETVTEAEAMRRYLAAHGVPAARILMEDASRDTKENVSFSAALLKAASIPEGARVAVVTNEFHIYRACRLVRDAGFEPVAVPAQTPYLWLRAAMYTREFCSVIFMWLNL